MMNAILDPKAIATVLESLPPHLRSLSRGIDHLGVAVRRLEDALPLYRDLLGLELLETETIESDGVKVAILDLGKGHLELLEPISSESPIAAFLDKRGPGLHHLALAVRDCEAAVNAFRQAGVRMIDTTCRPGAGGKMIAFCHPKSTGGVLLELCERVDG